MAETESVGSLTAEGSVPEVMLPALIPVPMRVPAIVSVFLSYLPSLVDLL